MISSLPRVRATLWRSLWPTAFAQVGLDWREHVVIDPDLFRPTEIAISRGNPRKSRETFGWQARYKMKEVVTLMVEDELQHLKGHGA